MQIRFSTLFFMAHENEMIDAFVTSKLIRDPSTKTGASGKSFVSFLLSVHVGDEDSVIVWTD